MLALDAGKRGSYNVGTDDFGTLRGDLEDLTRYADSRSEVKSLPETLTINTLRLLHVLRLSPLVPWHYLTYHKECYFDVQPLLKLGWHPRYSNAAMLQESYDAYIASAGRAPAEGPIGGSPHRSPLAQGALWIVKQFS
jgi:hypothetical protein